jgi:hypothetical protein
MGVSKCPEEREILAGDGVHAKYSMTAEHRGALSMVLAADFGLV